MNEQKLINLEREINLILETIPGIVGFAPLIEFDKSQNWIKIVNEENSNNLEISLGVIVNRNITSKNLSREISESIDFAFKERKIEYKLKKLNIYIKGAK